MISETSENPRNSPDIDYFTWSRVPVGHFTEVSACQFFSGKGKLILFHIVSDSWSESFKEEAPNENIGGGFSLTLSKNMSPFGYILDHFPK